ncbi:MAG: HD domain-containing protein [Muribaculaceae bacterium]|nr:HD domain-containing protein [Muribaculaceae bacterium]
MKHCCAVAELALDVAKRHSLPLDPNEIEAAAMLHDIGIFLTDAPDLGCHGIEPYIKHGILGADLLRREGYGETLARVAECHTGAGITAEEVARQNLPLPQRNYMPETMLERLVCYADKFYSKSGDMKIKTIEKVKASMEKISHDTYLRFMALEKEFGEENSSN